jgi:hypothetical protein
MKLTDSGKKLLKKQEEDEGYFEGSIKIKINGSGIFTSNVIITTQILVGDEVVMESPPTKIPIGGDLTIIPDFRLPWKFKWDQ